MKKLILLNPQWQGGGDTITGEGAHEFAEFYLASLPYAQVPVSLNAPAPKEYGIIAYGDLQAQMRQAKKLLRERDPDFIFTVGGGCDADVPVLACLSEKYRSELLVLWCDAHGDLNAPQESLSGLFYGMPARMLLEKSACFADIISLHLQPHQFIHFGGRDFDAAEIQYIKKAGITCLACEKTAELLQILSQHKNAKIYLHLDLDVLDPGEFPYTPLPVKGGVTKDFILQLLKHLLAQHDCVGVGLYEYAPCGQRVPFLAKIVQMLTQPAE